MFGTPNSTPVRNKLPVIVDIGIDTDGKQQYQVHESLRTVRKEMPRSSVFSAQEKTPVRNVLGTFSPPTSRKKIKLESVAGPPEALPGPEPVSLMQSGTENVALTISETPASSEAEGDSIWPEDLENAFEEVLAIIPKNGLSKIKISGRACGRNELISDYIYTKTGRLRTRKQVSSHIQVIKNLGQKPHIIKLINEGPQFDNDEERLQHAKRFEELFTKINLDKSLGLCQVPKVAQTTENKQAPPPRTEPEPTVNVENFFMSVYDSSSACPVILSLQTASQEMKTLQLRPGTNASRFPSLVYLGGSRIPVIHSMVRIHFPHLTHNYSFEAGLRTNFCVSVKEETIRNYANYTCIYSFGTPIVKFVEPIFDLNDNKPFLIKFWKVLLPRLAQDQSQSVVNSLRGLTVEQIIYETNHTNPPTAIPKRSIRTVLLWEFTKVEDFKDAVTTTSRISMVDSVPLYGPVEAQSVNVPPQMYSQGTFLTAASTMLPTPWAQEEMHQSYQCNMEEPMYMNDFN